MSVREIKTGHLYNVEVWVEDDADGETYLTPGIGFAVNPENVNAVSRWSRKDRYLGLHPVGDITIESEFTLLDLSDRSDYHVKELVELLEGNGFASEARAIRDTEMAARKAQEPTGLGAVVKVGEDHYTRIGDSDRPWRRREKGDTITSYRWDDLPMPEIISHGVDVD